MKKKWESPAPNIHNTITRLLSIAMAQKDQNQLMFIISLIKIWQFWVNKLDSLTEFGKVPIKHLHQSISLLNSNFGLKL